MFLEINNYSSFDKRIAQIDTRRSLKKKKPQSSKKSANSGFSVFGIIFFLEKLLII
jgi:hypothetical protein